MPELPVIQFRLQPDLLGDIDKLAREEHRTRSDMIRVLIIEAMAAREKQGRRR